MKKILIVLGTRPEAIKLISVIKELKKDEENFEVILCITGQHREMVRELLHEFDIVPEYDMDIMSRSQSLNHITTFVMNEVTTIISLEEPDYVMVQGDTTSAMAAALAAFNSKIPVVHVEAGLRTHDIYQPYPEEANRRIISLLTQIHFAPTTLAWNNLRNERTLYKNIHVVGNTGIDLLLEMDDEPELLDKTILITIHRRENLSHLEQICEAIGELSELHPEIKFLFCAHPNPQILSIVNKVLQKPNIEILVAPGYKKFVSYMKQCYFIITDSGGVQEEASVLGKPVLVVRNKTERVESLQAGLSKLVGVTKSNIIKVTQELLTNAELYKSMICKNNDLYGNGTAAKRICEVLKNEQSRQSNPMG